MAKLLIGIIGFGNMGSAIAQRIKSDYPVLIFDKDTEKTGRLSNKEVSRQCVDLAKRVNIIILAVKPQDIGAVLDEIRGYTKRKLIISIAAGITTEYIEKYLGKVRVIRIMPNLAVRVGRGMICLCKGSYATEEDLDLAARLFRRLGTTMPVEENLMDAVTAISGSGPGYLYDLMQNKKQDEWRNYARNDFAPLLSACAEELGFTPQQAHILAEVTVEGSIALLEESRLSPAELCLQVKSKGGTTEAGLEFLHMSGSLSQAVKAAKKRAEELSESK
jgi:pyrroline-5-carboxylate reductase